MHDILATIRNGILLNSLRDFVFVMMMDFLGCIVIAVICALGVVHFGVDEEVAQTVGLITSVIYLAVIFFVGVLYVPLEDR